MNDLSKTTSLESANDDYFLSDKQIEFVFAYESLDSEQKAIINRMIIKNMNQNCDKFTTI